MAIKVVKPETSKLFTSTKVGNVTIKNRFMRSATVINMTDPEGYITDDNCNAFRKLAEGGVGLLMTDAMAAHPKGRIFDTQIAAWEEKFIPGLSKLAATVHTYGDGCKVFPQIHSGGAKHWGYSYGQEETGFDVGVLTEEQIETIVESFGMSAWVLREAGFDGVQLHGGHGYLISQFLSPAINQRTDKWGGSIENRARICIEIFRAIRKRVGNDWPIGIKMNTRDYLEGGMDVEMSSQVAKLLADEGFAFIEMSGGMGYMTELREVLRRRVGEKEYYFYEAINEYLEKLKGTGITLAICGGIRTPSVMEELLDTDIDLISMCRPFICEPDFPNRIKAGDSSPSRCVTSYTLCNLCLSKCALDNVTCVKLYPGDCNMACPIEQEIPVYNSLIAQRKFDEALKVIKKDNPMPAVLGRVCHHPCETICHGEDGEPIAIRDLKRFVADYGLKKGLLTKAEPAVKNGRGKVAIVGSGPAGLACGYYLAQRGYEPTIFEKLPVKGGMLATCIPEYRLPKDILRADIDYIESAGVQIKNGTALGKDFTIDDLFKQGYQAVFLAIGAGKGAKIGVEGEDTPGAINGIGFLSDVKAGKKMSMGEKVGVIGGGNAAIDSARTTLRLGAKEVTIIYRRSRAEMPAAYEEIEDALEEGINIEFLTAPAKISKEGNQLKLTCTRMELGEPDESGRPKPIAIKGSEFDLSFDTIIAAIGEVVESDSLTKDAKLKLTSAGTIEADRLTLQTSIPGVFAGGDAFTGPNTVSGAVAAGKAAAESIDRFIQGMDLDRERQRIYHPYIKMTRPWAFADPSERVSKTNPKRTKVAKLSVAERKGNFKEVVKGLTEEEAVKEAKRCLKYDLDLAEKSEKRKAEMKGYKYDMSVYGEAGLTQSNK